MHAISVCSAENGQQVQGCFSLPKSSGCQGERCLPKFGIRNKMKTFLQDSEISVKDISVFSSGLLSRAVSS